MGSAQIVFINSKFRINVKNQRKLSTNQRKRIPLKTLTQNTKMTK